MAEDRDQPIRDQRVRDRAYHLWEQAGRPDGQSDQFWQAACALDDSEISAATIPVTEPAAAEAPVPHATDPVPAAAATPQAVQKPTPKAGTPKPPARPEPKAATKKPAKPASRKS